MKIMNEAWKKFEQQVADFFQGDRYVRLDYYESVGDIVHPHYSIECKYGGQVPAYMCPQLPTILTVGKKKYNLVPTKWIEVHKGLMYWQVLCWVRKKRRKAEFLEQALAQARGYNPTLPLVCVKPRGRHGFVVVWEQKGGGRWGGQ